MSTRASTKTDKYGEGRSGFVPDAKANVKGQVRLATNQEAALNTEEDVAVDAKQSRGIYPKLTLADDQDGTATITVQGVDAEDEDVAKQVVFDLWFAATSGAAPADLGEVAATTGTILGEPTTDAYIRVLSDANGEVVLDYTRSDGDGDVFVHVFTNPTLAIDSVTVSGNGS